MNVAIPLFMGRERDRSVAVHADDVARNEAADLSSEGLPQRCVGFQPECRSPRREDPGEPDVVCARHLVRAVAVRTADVVVVDDRAVVRVVEGTGLGRVVAGREHDGRARARRRRVSVGTRPGIGRAVLHGHHVLDQEPAHVDELHRAENVAPAGSIRVEVEDEAVRQSQPRSTRAMRPFATCGLLPTPTIDTLRQRPARRSVPHDQCARVLRVIAGRRVLGRFEHGARGDFEPNVVAKAQTPESVGPRRDRDHRLRPQRPASDANLAPECTRHRGFERPRVVAIASARRAVPPHTRRARSYARCARGAGLRRRCRGHRRHRSRR